MNSHVQNLFDRAMALPHGALQVVALEQIEQLVTDDEKSQFLIKMQLCISYYFANKYEQSIVSFYYCLKKLDEMPSLFQEWSGNILWLYKYVFAVIPSFLGITLPQINELLDDYRKRLLQGGYSERTYFYLRGEIARDLGELTVGQEYLDKAMGLRRDGQSDCKACERNYLATTYFEKGEWQRCITHVMPILRGQERCTSVPARTFGYSALAYIQLGKSDEANHALDQCVELTNSPRFLTQTGHCLEAAARLSRYSMGIDLLEMRFRWAVESTTCLNKLSLYSRAIYFLSQVVAKEDVQLRLYELPPKCQDKSASAVMDWLERESTSLAAAVDRRNGNTHWSQISLRMKEGTMPLVGMVC